MLIDVKGRFIDFDKRTMQLHERLYGVPLTGRHVMAQIDAVTVSEPQIRLENMTDAEVASLVKEGLEEDERIFSGLQ